MTATNHALTGAAIGLISGQPAIALPLALASHYFCDALPHFGANNPAQKLKSTGFRNYLIAEAILCVVIVLILCFAQPPNWMLAATCALVAAAPDLFSINRYLKVRAGRPWHGNLYSRFAAGIQWFERPIGLVVELAWLAALLLIILPIVF